jgi:signal peptidase II
MNEAPRPNLIALSLLTVGALAADQLSKHAVEKYTLPGSLRVLVPGLLNLAHTTNPGVAFGLFADSENAWRAPLLITFSVGVIAIGNVLDRFLHHSVTDFIDFHVGSHHWYTFNIADSAIVIGAALVVLELFRDARHPSQERA